jgi:chromosome segregation ATPase
LKSFTHKERSEVDIRIAQEIKNHKDWMHNTNQYINSLSEKVINLSLLHESSSSNRASEHKSLMIAFENLNENVNNLFKDLGHRIDKCEAELLRVVYKLRDINTEMSCNCMKKPELDIALHTLGSLVASQNLKQSLKNDALNQSLQQLQGQTQESLKALKEELTPKPPDIDPIKAQLDERFKVWQVDFDGLIREIVLLKKTIHYDQKKFEHIYTLIERIQAGKECHKKA